ncbi:MAG: hypothetical protein A2992_09040 [Elusimicrobia bacterium RIFCSPLOWO2_01_FULL_59_12]|nr:MAG: hypothetical protein A2992_09040 [Elusimicrobia bacterium RIFCSPLOWO2_01_FULL_59_12]
MNLQRFSFQRHPELAWEAALTVGGLSIIALTFVVYPRFDVALSTARPSLSSAEADRQVEYAKSYLTSHPEDMNTYVALAMAYYQKGPAYYVEGMNALEKARALGAVSDQLFYYAGVMYSALGLPDYAINEFSKYLRHHPRNYETMIRIANLHFQQKRIDQAQALYQEAIGAWPKDATAWFNYALVNKEKGKYAEALECLDVVGRIAGQLPPGGLYQRGEIYRLKGEPDKAFELYQQEIAAQPDYVPALEATETILKAKGEVKEARALRKRISELKKKQAQANS